MVKILDKKIETVGDIIAAFNQLDPDTPITPFGDSNTAAAYDDEKKIAYLDNLDFIETDFNEEPFEPVNEVPMEDDDYNIEEASY